MQRYWAVYLRWAAPDSTMRRRLVLALPLWAGARRAAAVGAKEGTPLGAASVTAGSAVHPVLRTGSIADHVVVDGWILRRKDI
jgi:hypothetical protein